MTKLEFSKYQGCGNDFVIIDAPFSQQISPQYRGKLAKFLCDRHFGIGADDVLYLEPSSVADAVMKVFDAQGPEADMCGNGIRCAGAYLGTKLNKTQVRLGSRKKGCPPRSHRWSSGLQGMGTSPMVEQPDGGGAR